jgi:hypothetical protein
MNKLIRYLTLIYACIALKPTTPNFCVNCKFFIKPDFFLISNKEFGKCKQFPKIIDEKDYNFFVTGIKKKQKIEYFYCSIVRQNEDKCGQEGKLYESN